MTVGEFKKRLKAASDDTDILDLLPEKKIVPVVGDIPTEMPQSGVPATFRHTVNLGDLIGAMGCIKVYHEITKRKGVVLQQINRPGQYYQGATHPTLDERGNPVTCNAAMFDMMKPLIESQPYIHSMEMYIGQKIDVDFEVIRGKVNVNMPHGTLQGWLPLAFPDLIFDISKPWIRLDGDCPAYIRGQVAGKVILNFTARYRANVDYFFLKNYAPDLVFSGTEKEHYDFCSMWNLSIPRLEIKNFLELGYALREARFSMSNQSMLWNLAQAMGTHRVLEMCHFADNCFPGIGAKSYGYFYQAGAEYYFRRSYNETA